MSRNNCEHLVYERIRTMYWAVKGPNYFMLQANPPGIGVAVVSAWPYEKPNLPSRAAIGSR